VDELHQRLITIALEAAAPHGVALGGGYAVQAHQFVSRFSDDVDLFTPWDRRGEVSAAVEDVTAAYQHAGYAVEVEQEYETFARLSVTDEAGSRTKVEIVADIRLNPPVQRSVGPVLHPDDVAAGKVAALYARAAARDYIDVAALLSGGHYTRDQLFQLARERDDGFEPEVFAQMLGGIERYRDAAFLRYGITPEQLHEVRQQIQAWRQELTEQS